jgi:hypothetical protein
MVTLIDIKKWKENTFIIECNGDRCRLNYKTGYIHCNSCYENELEFTDTTCFYNSYFYSHPIEIDWSRKIEHIQCSPKKLMQDCNGKCLGCKGKCHKCREICLSESKDNVVGKIGCENFFNFVTYSHCIDCYFGGTNYYNMVCKRIWPTDNKCNEDYNCGML